AVLAQLERPRVEDHGVLHEPRREPLLKQPRLREALCDFDPLARKHEIASRNLLEVRVEWPMELTIFGEIADHPRIRGIEARLDRSTIAVLPAFGVDRALHRGEPAGGGKRVGMQDRDPVRLA